MSNRLRFGCFVAPFHPSDEDPSLMMHRDIELAAWMDQLGFDEFWMGEHHSGGWEINASPELFIAAAAQHTRHIKFGTGVSSLPYHHPFILADRLRQLDHLTRGRAMFGFGPGSLPSDAHMQGIPTAEVRDRMDESLDAVVRLLRGETVTESTSWYSLQEARLQLLSYNAGGDQLAVANQVSPTGARAAGRLGLGMLSIGATSTGAFNALASNWAIAEDLAKDHGQNVDRSNWRLVGPIHVAETREQARADVRGGLERWIDYFANVAALPIAPPPGVALVGSGFAVIGTPDDCIGQINRLQEQSGGFGAFLNLHTPWANWQATKHSYELVARYVKPKINQINLNRQASEDWLRGNNDTFRGEMQAAVGARIASHAAEKGTEKLPPEIVATLSERS